MTAVTVETLVRLLHDFQNDHLIVVHGRELMIINVERLTKIAGMPLSLK